MTPDERTLLQRFLQDLVQTPAGVKDAEANDLIGGVLRDHPDAAYVLVQHAILSDQALHAAQGQVADLRQQLEQAQAQAQAAQAGRGFLGQSQPQQGGSPWGGQASPSYGQSSSYSQPSYGQSPSYAQQPAYPPPQPQYPPQGQGYVGSGPFSSGGGLGTFLRDAGTTAAGVAGGAFLFEGLSSMFGGHHGGGGGFGGWGNGGGGYGGGNETIVENVTNNNYYDDDDGDDDDSDDN